MAPIHISDRETDELVRRLAARRSLHLTEAIKLAVRNELQKDDDAEDVGMRNLEIQSNDKVSLVSDLEALMRSTTLDYTRLLAKQRGTKGVGSRVYQMLRRHGPVETLTRLISHHTEGLEFLKSIGRLELSAEAIALTPKYEGIITEEVRARAQNNLGKIK